MNQDDLIMDFVFLPYQEGGSTGCIRPRASKSLQVEPYRLDRYARNQEAVEAFHKDDIFPSGARLYTCKEGEDMSNASKVIAAKAL